MKPNSPLETLIDQSRKSRDLAGRTLAADRQGQQQAAEQLDALQQYKHEYCTKLHDSLARGVDAITLDNYRRFIRSLDHAIGQAGAQLQEQSSKVTASKEHWHDKQKRLSSLDTLANRQAAREREREGRIEQRLNDELTNNMQARKRAECIGSDR
ncbi:MAG TPA: flagellar export protein FliJ [Oleiagrimonas sp.]|nr:flagellar export protein FliJ [Oleiagrimonas sp.]